MTHLAARWLSARLLIAALAFSFFPACRGEQPPAGHDAPAPAPSAPPAGSIEAPPAPGGAFPIRDGFAPIAERLSPAVVNISASKRVPGHPRGGGPFFWDALGGQVPQPTIPHERIELSLGSGVIVSDDGVILTNYHVVESASEVRVFLSDRRERRARIVGTDPKTDLAVLKIDGEKLAFAPLGDSSKVRVGEIVLAIGNPYGLGQSVTLGIVSAVGRGNLGIVDHEDYIQTDAMISQGSSGGALVNTAGEVIGINAAVSAQGGVRGNAMVGFAIPSRIARAAMDQILRGGHVVRGWLGVGVQDMTPTIGDALGLNVSGGALINGITPGSPAEKAGLRRGDIVLELDGKPVENHRALWLRLGELAPGAKLRIALLRDQGARKEIEAVLGMPPEELARKAPPASAGEVGIGVLPLDPDLRGRFGIPAEIPGLVVVVVQPASQGAAAGVRIGDVIQEINRKPVQTVEEYDAAFKLSRRRLALLYVLRGGRPQYVVINGE